MENIDNDVKLIVYYLDKNYKVINNTLINLLLDKDEWGHEVIDEIAFMFSMNEEFVEEIVQSWVLSQGLPMDKWENAYESKKLNTIFNPLRRLELAKVIGVNAEKQLINELSQALSDEIDSEILKMLRAKADTTQKLEELLKCLGYEFGVAWHDPLTMAPNYPIVTTTEYRKINEQQNNPYWQDCF